MKFATLDAKMRRYEESLDQCIPPEIWPVVRLDGRGFSKLTNKINIAKPFDERFRDAMVATTTHVMSSGFRGVYAYVESDEISILFEKDDDTFQRKMRKWISILASEASAAFTHKMGEVVAFDARICPLPNEQTIVDYFRWRQEDSRRNSLNGYCYWTLRQNGYSQKKATAELAQSSVEELMGTLLRYGINFKEVPKWQKFGVGVLWQYVEKKGFNPKTQKQTTTQRRVLNPIFDLAGGEEYSLFLKETVLKKK